MSEFIHAACAATFYSGAIKVFTTVGLGADDLPLPGLQVFSVREEAGQIFVQQTGCTGDDWLAMSGVPTRSLGLYDPNSSVGSGTRLGPTFPSLDELKRASLIQLSKEVDAATYASATLQRQVVDLRMQLEDITAAQTSPDQEERTPILSCDTFGPIIDTWEGSGKRMLHQTIPVWHARFLGVGIHLESPCQNGFGAVLRSSEDGAPIARWRQSGPLDKGWHNLVLNQPLKGTSFGLKLELGGGVIGLAHTHSKAYAASGLHGRVAAMRVWRVSGPGPVAFDRRVRVQVSPAALPKLIHLTPGEESYATLIVNKDGFAIHALRRSEMIAALPLEKGDYADALEATAALGDNFEGPLEVRLQVADGIVQSASELAEALIVGDSGWIAVEKHAALSVRGRFTSSVSESVTGIFMVRVPEGGSQDSAWLQFSGVAQSMSRLEFLETEYAASDERSG